MSEEIRQLYKQYLLDVYPHSIDIALDRASGVHVWDTDGKEYLDFGAGIGANVLGHSHAAVLETIATQSSMLIHASNLFYTAQQAELAKLLCELCGLDKAYFSNSGAEAIETAIKAVRRWGNRQRSPRHEIICFESGWHGRTTGALSACNDTALQDGFGPLLDGFVALPAFDLDAIARAISATTAAVLIEPILGHGGVYLAPPGFLSELRTLCDKSGVLLVLDEIQTGAGRTGTYLYCEQHSVRPDVIALGKGLAGGMPVGATLFSNDVAQCMTVGSHGSTFGGNPLCSRVAYEVARVVSQEEFLANVRRIGQRFLSGLEMLQGQYGDTIRAARGVGLLCALELAIPCHPVQRALAASGLVCTTLGQNSLRFTAPLIIDQQHVDWALEVLDNTFCKL